MEFGQLQDQRDFRKKATLEISDAEDCCTGACGGTGVWQWLFLWSLATLVIWAGLVGLLCIDTGTATNVRHQTWAIIVFFIVAYVLVFFILVRTVVLAYRVTEDVAGYSKRRAVGIGEILDMFVAFALAAGVLFMTFWLIDPDLVLRGYYYDADGGFADNVWLVWVQFIGMGLAESTTGNSSIHGSNAWSQLLIGVIDLTELMFFLFVLFVAGDAIFSGVRSRARERHHKIETDEETGHHGMQPVVLANEEDD